MGRKFIVLTLVGLLLTVSACSYSTALEYKAIEIAGITFDITPLAEACIEKVEYANKEAPFVCPAVIEHNSFHKGHSYTWDTVVYSGSSNNTTFSLSATKSPDPRPGYISANSKLLELVTIQDLITGKREQTGITADFKPYETKVFKVTLGIPKEADVPPKWELRIKVKNITQSSNVQVAIDQRCLIDVKD